MFASNPMKLIFENGEITDFEQKRNPFAWVFFLACQKTGEAMELCKKELADDFLFYWVDGIFFRNNKEKIAKITEILKTLGFNSKLENVSNLRKSEKTLLFNKDGKEKILFLPQTNFEEMKEIKMKLGKYTTL
jgi:regulatory protein YycI of two-component signal transduction system YycFG